MTAPLELFPRHTGQLSPTVDPGITDEVDATDKPRTTDPLSPTVDPGITDEVDTIDKPGSTDPLEIATRLAIAYLSVQTRSTWAAERNEDSITMNLSAPPESLSSFHVNLSRLESNYSLPFQRGNPGCTAKVSLTDRKPWWIIHLLASCQENDSLRQENDFLYQENVRLLGLNPEIDRLKLERNRATGTAIVASAVAVGSLALLARHLASCPPKRSGPCSFM